MKLALIAAAVVFATPAAARAQQQTPSPPRTIRAEAAALKAVLVKSAPAVRSSRTGVVRTMTRPPKPAARNERQR
jgi:phage head maturation protease